MIPLFSGHFESFSGTDPWALFFCARSQHFLSFLLGRLRVRDVRGGGDGGQSLRDPLPRDQQQDGEYRGRQGGTGAGRGRGGRGRAGRGSRGREGVGAGGGRGRRGTGRGGVEEWQGRQRETGWDGAGTGRG